MITVHDSTTEWPDNGIDLVVTSPPYNLNKEYTLGDVKSEDYEGFTLTWLQAAYNALKPGGRLCVNVALDTNKTGQQYPMSFYVLHFALQIGFRYHTTIIWNEGTISKRTAWGSWKSASSPYVTAPVEVILVLYKGKEWKLPHKGESTISKENFIAWTNGLWTFGGESAKRVHHPAPFPVELPRRCIELFTYKDALTADPFSGSGSTAVAAWETGRRFIGYDLSPEYVKLATTRLQEAQNRELENLFV